MTKEVFCTIVEPTFLKEESVKIAFPEPIKPGVYFEKIEPITARTRLEYWFGDIHRFRLVSKMREINPDFDLPRLESRLAWGHQARLQAAAKSALEEDSDDEGLYD